MMQTRIYPANTSPTFWRTISNLLASVQS